MAINSQYPFSVEKDINLEYFDAEKAICMLYSDCGLNATFRGMFSDVAIENG